MSNEKELNVPKPVSAEKIVAQFEAETERVRSIGLALASIAIHSADERLAILTAADELTVTAAAARDAAKELEVVPIFGSEESYWTTYRMFAAGQNLGKPWAIEDIWDYLGRNCDMSQESLASIEATIAEWGPDIEEDAAAKGIQGRFVQLETGFMFAETAASVAARTRREAPAPLRSPRPAKQPVAAPVQIEELPAEIVEEPKTLDEQLDDAILSVLGESDQHIIKQADLKKAVRSQFEGIHIDHLQTKIDELVAEGHFYKFSRNKVSYLSLEPQQNETSPAETATGERKELIDEVDIASAIAILQTLTAPGTHFNQKLTLNELWRRINDADTKSQAIPEAELENLKRTSRQLQSIDLLTAGGEKMGTSGVKTNTATSSKRRRSGSRQVFKVGLESQERKKEVQELLGADNTTELLAQRFTAHNTQL